MLRRGSIEEGFIIRIHHATRLVGICLLILAPAAARGEEPPAGRLSAPTDDAQRLGSEAVFKRLEEFEATKDHAKAIAFLDQVLPTITDSATRWRLEQTRQIYLEWDSRYELALENARRLLAIESITSADHEWLLRSEAFNLVNSQQFDEYLAAWSRRFENAVDHPATRLKLLSERAQYYLGRPDAKRSIAAWREYRHATETLSDQWVDGTFLLAKELARAGELQSAIALWQELLTYYRASGMRGTANVLLSIADAQRAAGMLVDAERTIAEFEVAFATEPMLPQEAKIIRGRFFALREAMRRGK
ncbi:MAG TPA: hypothetical protein VGJ26_02155 [Pirellulales bacterium]|jgi:hypothetical protein